VCHTDAEGRIGARIEADHVELFDEGWMPGKQYHLRVVLTDAHAGAAYQQAGDNCGFAVTPYKPCDQNGFALEIDDLDGKPQGTFAAVSAGACITDTPPPGVDIYVLAWDLCWTAPKAGAGSLTAYVSVVDGNGGDGTMQFPADTTGDDVMSGAVPFPELGALPPGSPSGGCAVAQHDGDGSWLALIVLALVLVPARRKRNAVLALFAFAIATGCVHVRPRQRETLARKNMKFAPDPTEDELDLHMQEAREGSSGGYGSSGGGCGCN
jgi:MYXO-CTERM domain-containing protein